MPCHTIDAALSAGDESGSTEPNAERGGGAQRLDPAAVAAEAQRQPEGQPSLDGSAVRDEVAAAALGLTARSGSATAQGVPGVAPRRRDEVKRTFKSLGGAFKGMAKDVASASKSQLRSLAGGGRAQQPLVAAVAGISDGEQSPPSLALPGHRPPLAGRCCRPLPWMHAPRLYRVCIADIALLILGCATPFLPADPLHSDQLALPPLQVMS